MAKLTAKPTGERMPAGDHPSAVKTAERINRGIEKLIEGHQQAEQRHVLELVFLHCRRLSNKVG